MTGCARVTCAHCGEAFEDDGIVLEGDVVSRAHYADAARDLHDAEPVTPGDGEGRRP